MKQQKDYTYRSMRDEREYGAYWYSGLWKLLRPVLMGLAVTVIVVGLLSTAWGKVYHEFLAPMDEQNTAPVTFQVEGGQSLSRVSRNLEEAGLIRSKTVFKYFCDFSGFGQKIQAGTYLLNPSMTITEIADQLTTGDGNPLVRNITLIPGWTLEEFAAKLQTDGVIESASAFLDLCRTGSAFKDYYYVADVLGSKNVSARRYALEGYLAANTYEVYTNATPEEIIRKLLSQTENVFTVEDQDRAAEMGFTMDQILTLASMIEKEGKTEQFAKVSAVFHNRLRAGMPLGSDVTIHYITGVRKMALTSADLAAESPYNTYKYAGLPIGPICAPSKATIEAALYPDELFVAEKYLYFCSRDPESGELYFSKTQAEHDQACAIYAPLWQAWDKERGIE